jgi:hypothetical protein
MQPVRHKAQMYALLRSGAFGNTNPSWDDLAVWKAEAPRSAPLWGVRSMTVGDHRAQLDVPTDEVAGLVRKLFPHGGYNISPMVDQWLTLRCDVWESPEGFRVYGVEGRRDIKWREALGQHGREWTGLAARMLLRHHLNANSLADLEAVLELWPGHIVELTAMECCWGTVPGRNAVVWECRLY